MRKKKPDLHVIPLPLAPHEAAILENCRRHTLDAAFIWLRATHTRRGNQEFLAAAQELLCTAAGWITAASGREAAIDALERARDAVEDL